MRASNLVASRVVGDALRMVAGGGGDHAASAFLAGEREQFVQGAPLFESAGALLVVELEKDGIVGKAGKCFRVSAGGDADVGANSVESGLDVGKLDHDGWRSHLTASYVSLDRSRHGVCDS